jgi:hypothetical protein
LSGSRLGKRGEKTGGSATAGLRRFLSTPPLRIEETLSPLCRFNASKEDAMREDGNSVSGVESELAPKEMLYEVADFARKHGLSMVEARGLIEKVGYDCMKLDAAAKRLKRH